MIRLTPTNLVLGLLVLFFVILSVNGWIQLGRYKSANKMLIEEVEAARAKFKEADHKSEILISEIKVIKERREILDSLHKSNVKNRNNEKIKLIENACDSTIKRIVLDHIGSE
jgi:hypothetical protein